MLIGPFMTIILSALGVPADLAVKMAIATSMATIMFTSISSVRAHHKRGAVRWDIVKGLAPGIVIGGALASAGVFALLKGSYLAIFFALFVGFSATQMFLDKKPKPSRQMPGTAGQVAAGSVIGFLSGLVGAGGGFISVPFMVAHNASTPWPPVQRWAFPSPWPIRWVMWSAVHHCPTCRPTLWVMCGCRPWR
jgi:uncharacterized membrane protein YfcA